MKIMGMLKHGDHDAIALKLDEDEQEDFRIRGYELPTGSHVYLEATASAIALFITQSRLFAFRFKEAQYEYGKGCGATDEEIADMTRRAGRALEMVHKPEGLS